MSESHIKLAPSILAADCVSAGADVLVAGSAVFGTHDGIEKALGRLAAAIK